MSQHHQGDPCIHCGTPHDEVAVGPCLAQRHPWGEPHKLGHQHRICGQPRINPDFFPDPQDRAAYIRGYDGDPA